MIRAIVGPTATGKTELAIEVALQTGGEILCCDSMTVYCGMDVGTAKPSADQRRAVPHHLLDLADPREDFSVARFQSEARAALSRVEHPVVAGGSGLYFRAIVDELQFPPTDPAVRARIDAEPLDDLVARLGEVDPAAAGFLNLANKRRVVRALEVHEITGRPFSSFRTSWARRSDARVAGIDLDDRTLVERIRLRLERQLEQGLLEEVARLVAHGLSKTAAAAIPYAQAMALLDGRITQADFLEQATRATRVLARRQRAWFKADPRVRWFEAQDPHLRRKVSEYLTA